MTMGATNVLPSERVEATLREVAEDSATTFEGFLRLLDGLDPTEALAALRASAAGSGDPADLCGRRRSLATFLVAEATRVVRRALPQGRSLPLPHPLDAEWRFADETVKALTEELLRVTPPGETLLFHSTPTLAVAAADTTASCRFVSFGPDDVVGACVEAATGADTRFLPAAGAVPLAAVAVIDPPWYLPFYQAMLPICAAGCRVGARIYIVVPPAGVRPSAASDAAAVVRIAARCGLRQVERRRGGVGYRSPLFEIAAFEAAGVLCAPATWRRGDLLLFEKFEEGSGKRSGQVRAKLPAFEVTVSGVRLRVLARPAVAEPISTRRPDHPATPTSGRLSAVASTDVFPSVSARASGRGAATFWTSTNRAFSIDPRLALCALAEVARHRGVPLPASFKPGLDAPWRDRNVDAIRTLSHHIDELVDREIFDAERLVGERSWERATNDARFLNGSCRTFLTVATGAAA